MKISKCIQLLGIFTLIVVSVLGLVQAKALAGGITPPDLAVCDEVNQCEAPDMGCKDGHTLSVTFKAGNTMPTGYATYMYHVCSPAKGTTCTYSGGTTKNPGGGCADDNACQLSCGGPSGSRTCSGTTISCDTAGTSDPKCAGTCNRVCDVPDFQALAHFDVPLTDLFGASGCVDSGAMVTVECTEGSEGLDASPCFTSTDEVATCKDPMLDFGECFDMTISIPSETVLPGLANAVLVDKEADVCSSICFQGPSCDPCGGETEGELCLTRSLGFWGTHPWITNDYAPVTVCGNTIGCDGAGDGKSDPSCEYDHCDDIMEGLGSIGGELKTNQPYVAMVKQLTAAYLNLNASSGLFDGSCSSFCWNNDTKMQVPDEDGTCPENTESIQDVIERCEGLCDADKSTISSSGCIEALDAFNGSDDVLPDDTTPPPFDRPPVDDSGNISGADPTSFTKSNKDKVVIGKDVNGGGQCAP
jgi:hypothetical protein